MEITYFLIKLSNFNKTVNADNKTFSHTYNTTLLLRSAIWMKEAKKIRAYECQQKKLNMKVIMLYDLLYKHTNTVKTIENDVLFNVLLTVMSTTTTFSISFLFLEQKEKSFNTFFWVRDSFGVLSDQKYICCF